jgi:hypothetical protein
VGGNRVLGITDIATELQENGAEVGKLGSLERRMSLVALAANIGQMVSSMGRTWSGELFRRVR